MKLWLKNPDILVLPETFNTGFFPTDNLEELADKEGQTTKKAILRICKKNTFRKYCSWISYYFKKLIKYLTQLIFFDKHGKLVAEYDKIHGFTPSGEHNYYQGGNN